MLELGNTPDKPHRKCARIVGDCLGKYHPHGDYLGVRCAGAHGAAFQYARARWSTAMATSAPWTATAAAAMRYTEARMTPLAMELLRDLEKDTVSFSSEL